MSNHEQFPSLPAKWNGWQIKEEIGRGSYGTVYAAEHTKSNEVCAFKLITVFLPENTNFDMISKDEYDHYYHEIMDDFVQGIKTVQKASDCENIIQYMDYEISELRNRKGWMVYIQMELLTPFEEYVISHKMTEADVIQLGIDICRALEVLEKNKLLHRDIKPSNILVTEDGIFKLGDFGIAKDMTNNAMSMTLRGTFGYLAPEVLTHQNVDYSSDIYSLGLVLYKLLNQNKLPFEETGKRFVSDKGASAALAKRLSGKKMSAPMEASKTVAGIILKACSFDKSNRYHTANAMRRDLELFNREYTSFLAKNVQSHKALFTVFFLMNIILAVILLFTVYRYKGETIDDIYADVYLENLGTDTDHKALSGEQLYPSPLIEDKYHYLISKNKDEEYVLFQLQIALKPYNSANGVGYNFCKRDQVRFSSMKMYSVQQNKWIDTDAKSDQIEDAFIDVIDAANPEIFDSDIIFFDESTGLRNTNCSDETKIALELIAADESQLGSGQTINEYLKSGTYNEHILGSWDFENHVIPERILQQLSDKQLFILEAEIYARHGYTFADSALQRHFESISWYIKNEISSQGWSNDVTDLLCLLTENEIRDILIIHNEQFARGIIPVLSFDDFNDCFDLIIGENIAADYVLPLSSSVYYSEFILCSILDAYGYDRAQMARMAECEIYARHGYTFNDMVTWDYDYVDWKEYFSAFDWYQPNELISYEAVLSALNEYELANINLIKRSDLFSYTTSTSVTLEYDYTVIVAAFFVTLGPFENVYDAYEKLCLADELNYAPMGIIKREDQFEPGYYVVLKTFGLASYSKADEYVQSLPKELGRISGFISNEEKIFSGVEGTFVINSDTMIMLME